MVLQDSGMGYRSTIYSMITDIDEDEEKQQKIPEIDSLVWDFLRLVQIDDSVRDELDNDLDEAMESKLRGGQRQYYYWLELFIELIIEILLHSYWINLTKVCPLWNNSDHHW